MLAGLLQTVHTGPIRQWTPINARISLIFREVKNSIFRRPTQYHLRSVRLRWRWLYPPWKISWTFGRKGLIRTNFYTFLETHVHGREMGIFLRVHAYINPNISWLTEINGSLTQPTDNRSSNISNRSSRWRNPFLALQWLLSLQSVWCMLHPLWSTTQSESIRISRKPHLERRRYPNGVRTIAPMLEMHVGLAASVLVMGLWFAACGRCWTAKNVAKIRTGFVG